jgi:hypothetical protein
VKAIHYFVSEEIIVICEYLSLHISSGRCCILSIILINISYLSNLPSLPLSNSIIIGSIIIQWELLYLIMLYPISIFLHISLIRQSSSYSYHNGCYDLSSMLSVLFLVLSVTVSPTVWVIVTYMSYWCQTMFKPFTSSYLYPSIITFRFLGLAFLGILWLIYPISCFVWWSSGYGYKATASLILIIVIILCVPIFITLMPTTIIHQYTLLLCSVYLLHYDHPSLTLYGIVWNSSSGWFI